MTYALLPMLQPFQNGQEFQIFFNWLEDLHPKFQKQKAIDKLKNTNIPLNAKIKELSKGMTVQVHLSIVLAIDAKVLVLDEPTLGLDIMNRRSFYDAVLRDFFDEERTILVTTHQIDEIEPILSHAIFIKDGEVTPMHRSKIFRKNSTPLMFPRIKRPMPYR